MWDVKQLGADILILNGDNVNGGRAVQQEVLAEKLHNLEKQGVPVYLIPGNHDMGPIGREEWEPYFHDFGFSEARSRDSSSLLDNPVSEKTLGFQVTY